MGLSFKGGVYTCKNRRTKEWGHYQFYKIDSAVFMRDVDTAQVFMFNSMSEVWKIYELG